MRKRREALNDTKVEQICDQILDLARNKLLVNLRFMSVPLSHHKRARYDGTFGTDGEHLFSNPLYVLQCYSQSQEELYHLYLHTLLHCIFIHPFVGANIEFRLWNLAADIAVENCIYDLNVSNTHSIKSSVQKSIISEISKSIKLLTAEKIYTWLKSSPLSEDVFRSWEEAFSYDDHRFWYSYYLSAQLEGNTSDRNDDGTETDDIEISLDRRTLSEAFWKRTSQQVQMDLEAFGKQQGTGAGALSQNLKEVNRERYDYRKLLKRFAVLGEVMKTNEDEFDYIYYVYRLTNYKKMPLIEPLEYKETKRIREFVIAIDTSGSVAGEEVQTFLQKTYNILKQEESYFSKINIHIIQCDADIQEDKVITTQKELDDYIRTIKLHGFGGTDFRPVFDYVDELIKNKTFNNLKGMLYFTDGYGVFPNRKPAYTVAFVFVRDDYEVPEVPGWAIKMILQKEDIYNI